MTNWWPKVQSLRDFGSQRPSYRPSLAWRWHQLVRLSAASLCGWLRLVSGAALPPGHSRGPAHLFFCFRVSLLQPLSRTAALSLRSLDGSFWREATYSFAAASRCDTCSVSTTVSWQDLSFSHSLTSFSLPFSVSLFLPPSPTLECCPGPRRSSPQVHEDRLDDDASDWAAHGRLFCLPLRRLLVCTLRPFAPSSDRSLALAALGVTPLAD